jgi:hypothetical protein
MGASCRRVHEPKLNGIGVLMDNEIDRLEGAHRGEENPIIVSSAENSSPRDLRG